MSPLPGRPWRASSSVTRCSASMDVRRRARGVIQRPLRPTRVQHAGQVENRPGRAGDGGALEPEDVMVSHVGAVDCGQS